MTRLNSKPMFAAKLLPKMRREMRTILQLSAMIFVLQFNCACTETDLDLRDCRGISIPKPWISMARPQRSSTPACGFRRAIVSSKPMKAVRPLARENSILEFFRQRSHRCRQRSYRVRFGRLAIRRQRSQHSYCDGVPATFECSAKGG